MARNADLRKLVQDKLGIERAQLYRVANDLADKLSIKTADAILLLAAKNHINLQKYGGNISTEKLQEIRGLLPLVSGIAVAASVATSSKGKPRKVKSRTGFKVKLQAAEDDPVLSKATHTEMEAMVPVYRILYQLENSVRQFITRVLTAKHGEKWWDKLATSELKKTYAKHTRAEEINAWHQRRSRNPIDYLDLDQLPILVRVAQVDFVPRFFKTEGWFQNFVEEIYQSRCVVCHMNPLTENNVTYIGVRFNHWENLVKEKIHEIEKLEGRDTMQPSTSTGEAPRPATVVASPSLPKSGSSE